MEPQFTRPTITHHYNILTVLPHPKHHLQSIFNSNPIHHHGSSSFKSGNPPWQPAIFAINKKSSSHRALHHHHKFNPSVHHHHESQSRHLCHNHHFNYSPKPWLHRPQNTMAALLHFSAITHLLFHHRASPNLPPYFITHNPNFKSPSTTKSPMVCPHPCPPS
jgi:hypothetical protein